MSPQQPLSQGTRDTPGTPGFTLGDAVPVCPALWPLSGGVAGQCPGPRIWLVPTLPEKFHVPKVHTWHSRLELRDHHRPPTPDALVEWPLPGWLFPVKEQAGATDPGRSRPGAATGIRQHQWVQMPIMSVSPGTARGCQELGPGMPASAHTPSLAVWLSPSGPTALGILLSTSSPCVSSRARD